MIWSWFVGCWKLKLEIVGRMEEIMDLQALHSKTFITLSISREEFDRVQGDLRQLCPQGTGDWTLLTPMSQSCLRLRWFMQIRARTPRAANLADSAERMTEDCRIFGGSDSKKK